MRHLAAVMLAAIAFVLAARADATGAPIDVRARDGRISLAAADRPLGDVMRELAAKLGFVLVLNGKLPEKISVSFSGLTPEEAIRRLVGMHSFVVEFDAAETRRIARLTVIARPLPVPPKVAPAAVVAADRQARLREIRALRQTRSAAAATRLAEIVRSEPDAVLRLSAVAALGIFKDNLAVDPLAAALADPDSRVRLRAITALGRTGSGAARPRLEALLREGASPRERALAARALGTFPAASTALQAALSDPEPTVRDAVRAALARLERR